MVAETPTVTRNRSKNNARVIKEQYLVWKRLCSARCVTLCTGVGITRDST